MTNNRKGERGFPPFRSGRLFSADGFWFFSTREGDLGPFPTRALAEQKLSEYLRDIETLQDIREMTKLNAFSYET